MIHEKLMSGQFLLDLQNDRAGLLHSATHHHQHSPQSHHHNQHFHHRLQAAQQPHHHHHQQQQHNLHQRHHQPPQSSAMPAVKVDLYSAYAYQHHLQQQLIGNGNAAHHQSAFSPPAEVLDLSRRCDSVETPRKTPSPYQTNSSLGTVSPAASPTNAASQLLATLPPTGIPANLLYSTPMQHVRTQQSLSSGLAASLYPSIYYPAAASAIKQEPQLVTPTASPPPAQALPAQLPVAATNLLQTFASAAAVAAASVVSMQIDSAEPHSPIRSAANDFIASQSNGNLSQHAHTATTPTSSTTSTAVATTLDTKSTRPFKAFPRDPLVIAANFAATDVLLDNPRVERYTEYRKRMLEQIRSSNGGTRTVTNPKMRRTNSRNGSINECGINSSNSNNNSENEEQRNAVDESSDCDSNAGNFEKMTTSTSSTGSNADGSYANGCGSQVKDAAYYERRRKNNAAAKKSRDRRRIKEDEIAIRAAYLERQNIELLCQIDALKSQIAAFTSKVGA